MRHITTILCVLLLMGMTVPASVLALEADPGFSETRSKYFGLRLYSEKTVYTADEGVDCYAVMEYLGTENATMPFSPPHLSLQSADGTVLLRDEADCDYYDFMSGEDWADSRYRFLPAGARAQEQNDLRRVFSYEQKLRLEPGTYTITAKIAYGESVKPIMARRVEPVCTQTQTVSRTIKVLPAKPMPELGFDRTRSGTFELKLYTDKPVYTEGEEIQCFATLEYIGDAEKIMLITGDPVVNFAFSDGGRLRMGGFTNDVAMLTEYVKGEPARFDFVKSGSYSPEEKVFWEPFYARRELVLPPGAYTITASIDGDLSNEREEPAGAGVSLQVSRTITVKAKDLEEKGSG